MPFSVTVYIATVYCGCYGVAVCSPTSCSVYVCMFIVWLCSVVVCSVIVYFDCL